MGRGTFSALGHPQIYDLAFTFLDPCLLAVELFRARNLADIVTALYTMLLWTEGT